MPCLAKIEGQLKTEARRLSKKSQKVERTLKEGMLNNKNKDDSEAHNEIEKKTILKCLSKHIVILVIVIILFILVKDFC